ncbi:hypothetical protein K3495_g2974 [Podosphaera aphanis]|nr:hypothetical protein K3495_g2974 [Podosphaera aphanis]
MGRGSRKGANFAVLDELDTYLCSFDDSSDALSAYLTAKAESNLELALILGKEGKKTSQEKPSQQADNKEIDCLLATVVFKFEKYGICDLEGW